MICLIQNVVKRDGRVVAFDRDKITEAILKAVTSVGGSDRNLAEKVTDLVEEVLEERYHEEYPTVEQVQDAVEKALIEKGHAKTAKAYILYRAERTRVREMDSSLMESLRELTFTKSLDSDIKRENANIDADTAMGTMLKYGSEASKTLSHLCVLTPQQSTAHKEGDIHIHDLDFLNLTMTCVQTSIGELLARGFSTGHGFLRTPNSIGSAASLACIAIQSCQNDMHGGQSIWDFDYGLAPYVAKSYITEVINHIEDIFEEFDENKEPLVEFKQKMQDFAKEHKDLIMSAEGHEFVEEGIRRLLPNVSTHKVDRVFKKVLISVDKLTYQAMEAVVHNLNTMQSRAGGQVPFSSINYGTDISQEGRMIIKNILKATEAGLGKGETPIFPVQIFKIKEGVNYNYNDPNYDLFQLAMQVSAKRLFPNFEFIDAPFNLQFYKPGRPETEIATMGCVEGQEVIAYAVDNKAYVEPFEEAYERISQWFEARAYSGVSHYIDVEGKGVKIYDGKAQAYIPVKKFIKNDRVHQWAHITLSNGRVLTATTDHPLFVMEKGRTLVSDLELGDSLIGEFAPMQGDTFRSPLADNTMNAIAYAFGAMTGYGNKLDPVNMCKILDWRESGAMLSDSMHTKRLIDKIAQMYKAYSETEIPEHKFRVPEEVFMSGLEVRAQFMAGMIDACAETVTVLRDGKHITLWKIIKKNKGLILQLMYLLQSINIPCEVYRFEDGTYQIQFAKNGAVTKYMQSTFFDVTEEKDLPVKSGLITVEKIEFFYGPMDSYDVETETDMFNVSGILSHNCRTRVIGNAYDPSREIVAGRGNLSFTSINLPRLAIEAHKDITKFYKLLDKTLDLVVGQLLDRMRIQAKKHVYNFPMLMGQGVWLDSDKLQETDTIEEVIKHGTLTVGFIGLAECLKALIGKHHGESADAQKLGLEIIGHMRKRMDDETTKRHLNFSLIGTPAEGLSGRFVRLDRQKYGVIPGVTDKEWYTNSSHIPVEYHISAAEKIRLEAPYHELENGGHICYVELDGDPSQNLSAFETIIRCMHDNGVGYGAVNHPVDRCRLCGFQGIVYESCPVCGAIGNNENIARIRRITGYLVGTTDRFNNAKRAEEQARVKHGG